MTMTNKRKRQQHQHQQKQKQTHHDLHVPLSSASASSSKRKLRQEAQLYQARLHQLGYDEVAFTHTTYANGGKLNEIRDDADVALPWKDLLGGSGDGNGDGEEDDSSPSFGRINHSLGLKIYRRLNIVAEEVSDVSRLLLHNNNASDGASSSSSSISKLLKKYDIVSLQPMSEPVLQSVCEMLSSNIANDSSNNNNLSCIDIMVLEYATGSRGGFGLPYKLRKDYLMKALGAGVTFELSYSTAILDATKRRQGFLRTLMDFQSAYDGIQKKHTLINNNKRKKGMTCDTQFPLLLSSGSRQNFTLGTGDQGVLALRSPEDVRYLACHLGGIDNGYFDHSTAIDVDVDRDDGSIIRNGKQLGEKKRKRRNKQVSPRNSAAQRVLEKARDRSMGVVTSAAWSKHSPRGNRSFANSQACVVGMANQTRTAERNSARGNHDEEEDDDDDDDLLFYTANNGGTASLIDWLSVPMQKKAKDLNDEIVEEHATTASKTKEIVVVNNKRISEEETTKDTHGGLRKKENGDDDSVAAKTTSLGNDPKDADEVSDEEEDVLDGFIAL